MRSRKPVTVATLGALAFSTLIGCYRAGRRSLDEVGGPGLVGEHLGALYQ